VPLKRKTIFMRANDGEKRSKNHEEESDNNISNKPG